MKTVILLIALLAAAVVAHAAVAHAETIVVVSASAQLRAQPSAKSKAVGLVFGNETYEVLEQNKGWFRIRNARDREGWLSIRHADVPQRVVAKAGTPRSLVFSQARGLHRVARAAGARMVFAVVMAVFPDTYEFYEATRYLLAYHKMDKLPLLPQKRVTADQLEQARKAASKVLKAEVRAIESDKQAGELGPPLEKIRKTLGESFSMNDALERLIDAYVDVADDAGGEVEKQARAIRSAFRS